MEFIKFNKFEIKKLTSKEEYDEYVEMQNKRSGGSINHNQFIQDISKCGYKLNLYDNIIDVGCRGNAQLLINLINLGYENVYGIDIGYEAEKMWKNLFFSLQKNLKRLDIHEGIGFDLKFNVITSSHVLEHCYDPEKVIKVFYNSLENNGILHLQIPLSTHEEYMHHGPHYSFWKDMNTFISWLYDLGFETIFSEERNLGGHEELCVILKKYQNII